LQQSNNIFTKGLFREYIHYNTLTITSVKLSNMTTLSFGFLFTLLTFGPMFVILSALMPIWTLLGALIVLGLIGGVATLLQVTLSMPLLMKALGLAETVLRLFVG